MKTKKLFALIILAGLCMYGIYGSTVPGTILVTGDVAKCWTGGTIKLVDSRTGLIDTLIKDGDNQGAYPVFSPDGRNVVYCASDGINIININTREIVNIMPQIQGGASWENGWYSCPTWSQDSFIYFTYWRWICRVNIHTKQVDSVYLVRGIVSSEDSAARRNPVGKENMSEGNVSRDGKRAVHEMDDGGAGNTFSIDIVNKTEVDLGSGNATCQASLSWDGKFGVHSDHATNWVRPFHQKDSIYKFIDAPDDGPIWMNRFSSNSNNFVLFHSEGVANVYLWQLDINRYEAVTQAGCGWDFYAGGWVLDTIPPAAPTDILIVKATGNAVNLSWSAPVSGIAPIGYVIERNGVKVGETESTSYTDTLLEENTTIYDYVVYGRTNGIAYSSPLSGSYSTAVNRMLSSAVSLRPTLSVSPKPFASQVNISYSLPI